MTEADYRGYALPRYRRRGPLPLVTPTDPNPIVVKDSRLASGALFSCP